MKYIISLLFVLSFNSYATIGVGEIIDHNDINNLKQKSERKRKCITRNLTSNVKYADLVNVVSPNNKNSYLDSMKIGGLTIGKRYEVTLHAYLLNIRVSQHELNVFNANNTNSNFIVKLRYYNNSTTIQHIEFEKKKDFIASDSTISVMYSINSGTVDYYNATNLEPQLVSGSTSIKVCEADHRENLTNATSF